jgi:hypothetical protein
MYQHPLLESLIKEVEQFIRKNEGQFRSGVRRDFRDGLARKTQVEKIRWCNRWRKMYYQSERHD